MILALSMLFLNGCAARRPFAGQVQIPRNCMIAVDLTDQTECHGKPGETLHCTGIKLTKIKGCETLNAKPKAGK